MGSAPLAPPAAVASVAAAAPPVCARRVPARCEGPAPSLTRDVLPVVQKRCFGCHAGDGVAADEHDFAHPGALEAARAEVGEQVGACAMPPRAAIPDADADLLLRWAACGEAGR